MDLVNLQFWNCMDYDFTVIVKQFVAPMRGNVVQDTLETKKGTYDSAL